MRNPISSTSLSQQLPQSQPHPPPPSSTATAPALSTSSTDLLSRKASVSDFPAIPISTPTPSISLMSNSGPARQNFSVASEEALNHQINLELKASHIYLSLHAFFLRDSIALPGFAKYFKEQSDEERGHGEKLIKYLTLRGGKVILENIPQPDLDFNSAVTALEITLQLEREVNKSLLNLHKIAENQSDPQMCDFIESEYLEEQVEAIKQVSDMLTQVKRCGGDGVGLWLFDKSLDEKK